MDKKKAGIEKIASNWLWRWAEPETQATVLPKSKTQRLALQAKLANVDAERAVSRAYQMEIARTKAVGEAMFKSGKALRYSFVSAIRQVSLRLQAIRRQILPSQSNKNR